MAPKSKPMDRRAIFSGVTALGAAWVAKLERALGIYELNLPHAVHWLLPTLVGAPLIWRALRKPQGGGLSSTVQSIA